ncbi:glutamine amidotransferase-related protein [Corynebacterium bovis]|uniref:glutamine amidotransferase-related protein n=1 Tax=Corynebacterium bovis TaxID=36808 RepID=UPI003C7AFBE2
MDSSLIVLRHVAFEDLGTWGAVAERAGFRTEYRDVGSDVFRLDDATASADDLTELMEADLVVVLGAPLGLDDTGSYPYLDSEVELIRRRLAARRPVLGVCLGAQLMARALGGTVSTPDRPMQIGWGSVTLTEAGRGARRRRAGGPAGPALARRRHRTSGRGCHDPRVRRPLPRPGVRHPRGPRRAVPPGVRLAARGEVAHRPPQ